MIKTYKQAKAYLDSFVNYEQTPSFAYRQSFKLTRMQLLLRRLAIDCRPLKVIHIAGTKGKGSTAGFLANFLAGLGYRAGLYTSPHFFNFRERIQVVTKSQRHKVTSCLIGRRDVAKIVEEFRKRLEKLELPQNLGKISFFEVYTAVAIKYFLDQQVDFAVLETGLGGRLDATNILKPLVCLITSIGYDHMYILGRSLKEIAAQKAGIIKKNIPVLTSRQNRSAFTVIKNRAKQQNAALYVLGKDFSYDRLRLKKDYTGFDFRFQNNRLKNLKIIPKGKHQVENSCLALSALFVLKEQGYLNKDIQLNGSLTKAAFAGRFEIVQLKPLIIVDVAHNSSSFAALADNLRLYFPRKKIILIFAACRDKDALGMLKQINPDKLIFTTFSNPRAFTAEELQKISKIKSAITADDLGQAFRVGLKLYRPGSLVLVAGSFFLAAEAKKMFKRYV